MPSWRLHVTTGIILTAMMIYGFFISDLWYLFIDQNQIQFFFIFHIVFISVLGSLMPDFDYRKTRIRNAFGPVLGGFICLSYIYQNNFEPSRINPAFLLVLMIVFILLPFIAGIVIPFKHHGKLHSILSAGVYSISWAGLELFIFSMSEIQAATVFLFGFVGYFSHLLLDGDLKLL
jgi:hypothetical protein